MRQCGKMSCGNSKQQLESLNALSICMALYRNSDGIITECGCPFIQHLNEIMPPQAQPGNFMDYITPPRSS